MPKLLILSVSQFVSLSKFEVYTPYFNDKSSLKGLENKEKAGVF